ncbi:CRAL-TRIO lipid binding domain [Dillenia turbinata]|uniref:CRAL-TRIO lipid binding domain n=1 Tax=Dillenia turbinata TaxID=194707 RepID=A0AAN8WD37_9MAGN
MHHMSKEKNSQIVVSGGGERSNYLASQENRRRKAKGKLLHPPIESHFSHLSTPERKPRSWSSLTQMLVHPKRRFKRSKTLETILHGAHDPIDDRHVRSLRQLLLSEGLLDRKHNDYHTLLRFLRMRDFDVQAAKDAFLKFLEWREEFGVDSISKDFKFDEIGEVKKCYPHGFHGVDRYGRPVYIERIGMLNLDAFLQVTSIDRFVKHHVSEQERTMKTRYPACSLAAKRHVASTTSVIDVKGVGIRNFSRPARHLFMEIQKIDSSYYPETLNQLFIVNAGSGFRALWKALSAFLDQRTLAKIQVMGSDYQCKLLEAIEPSNLPSFLGGTCKCSDYGGCLISDKGPWNNPEIQEMLRAIFGSEEESESGESTGTASEDDMVSSPWRRDISDLSTIDPRELKRSMRMKYLNKLVSRKIQALDAALQETKMKIQALEVALEDTKLVLQGLTQHIQGIKIRGP